MIQSSKATAPFTYLNNQTKKLLIFPKFFGILLVSNKEASYMIIRSNYMNTLKTYRDVPLVYV